MHRDNSNYSISRPVALVLTLALFAGSLLLYSLRADTAVLPPPEPPASMTAFTGSTFDRRLNPEGVTRVSSAGRDFTFIVFDTSGYAATD